MQENALVFKCGDVVQIHSTTDSNYDGVIATVVGVSTVDMATSQAFYILEKVDGSLFKTTYGEWKVAVMTQFCLQRYSR